MQPIDSYREKAFFGYRLIELFDDHVIVSGYRAFGTDFKLNVPLGTLEPNISHLGIREQTRLIGLIVFIGGTIGALAWGSYPPMYRNVGFWICSFFAVFGLHDFGWGLLGFGFEPGLLRVSADKCDIWL